VKYPRFLGNRAPFSGAAKTRASFISPRMRFSKNIPLLGGYFEVSLLFEKQSSCCFVRVPHAHKFATRFPVLRLRRPKCSQQQNRYPVELAQPRATSRYPPQLSTLLSTKFTYIGGCRCFSREGQAMLWGVSPETCPLTVRVNDLSKYQLSLR
jgi:hypothetical protein